MTEDMGWSWRWCQPRPVPFRGRVGHTPAACSLMALAWKVDFIEKKCFPFFFVPFSFVSFSHCVVWAAEDLNIQDFLFLPSPHPSFTRQQVENRFAQSWDSPSSSSKYAIIWSIKYCENWIKKPRGPIWRQMIMSSGKRQCGQMQ